VEFKRQSFPVERSRKLQTYRRVTPDCHFTQCISIALYQVSYHTRRLFFSKAAVGLVPIDSRDLALHAIATPQCIPTTLYHEVSYHTRRLVYLFEGGNRIGPS
jgi:hypothetical protein